MRLVFASNNAHKLAEVRAIMPEGIEVLSLHDIGFEQEIAETGATLEENSKIKAEAVYQWILDNGQWTLDGVFADDTGLEIDALGGKPGVYTARWAGEPAANRKKAIAELADKEDRRAQFRTVITLAFSNRCAKVYTAPLNKQAPDASALPKKRSFSLQMHDFSGDPNYIQVEGIVRGQIAKEEYGEGGFGYDPVFIPEGYDKTFGELPAEVKNNISHRSRALAELVKVLQR